MFKIIVPNSVEKEFYNLPEEIQPKIREKLNELKQNPRPYGVKMLKGKLNGSWRIRVGNYRIIYDIFDKEKTIVITDIGHRKDIYS